MLGHCVFLRPFIADASLSVQHTDYRDDLSWPDVFPVVENSPDIERNGALRRVPVDREACLDPQGSVRRNLLTALNGSLALETERRFWLRTEALKPDRFIAFSTESIVPIHDQF